ncbi:hypothetical protein D8B46_06255 [Candidatus Gracilibacteria bacterium]|nr:MAG: hypothetical protein D8B46_06255 [Candidatus Gracilibacteria bacterium]
MPQNELSTIDFEPETQTVKETPSSDKISKNIFSDFDSDSSLEVELKNIKEKENKDIFYYLFISGKVLQTLCFLLFFGIILGYSYIFIQKSDTFSNKNYLTPICSVFNGEIEQSGSGCSSISYNKNLINEQLKTLNKEQSKLIFSLLPLIYENDNFLRTREVSFLLEKSSNKLKVLDILEKFDYFKNDFTGFEKKKLQCSELNIDSKQMILSMKCQAFAGGYTSEIIGFSGNKNSKQDSLNGTSISIANSFINFLEKNATKYFLVVERQKIFESQPVIGKDGYTNQTNFDLKLKINF